MKTTMTFSQEDMEQFIEKELNEFSSIKKKYRWIVTRAGDQREKDLIQCEVEMEFPIHFGPDIDD